jgi:hypothetical protein
MKILPQRRQREERREKRERIALPSFFLCGSSSLLIRRKG